MPFTPAHAAAALPFRKTGLCFAAVVVGTLSPDFEYYLRLSATGTYGHGLSGLLLLDLPFACLILVLFNRYARYALPRFWPRLFVAPKPAALGDGVQVSAKSMAITLASILVGAFTHLLWDAFTHPVFWPYQHLQVLRMEWSFGHGHSVQTYKILQHVSTLVGLSLIAATWLRPKMRWRDARDLLPSAAAWIVVAAAVLLAVLRVYVGAQQQLQTHQASAFASQFVVTAIAALWLGSIFVGMRVRRMHPTDALGGDLHLRH